jgi:HK97 gp10 family phage protein
MKDFAPMANDGALIGASDLLKKLDALGALDNGNIIKGTVRAGMQPAKQAAITKIPVGTRLHRTYKGRLVAPGFAKRSIRVVVTSKTDSGNIAALLSVRAEAYYAVQFVERGTSKMKAQPWLRSAFFNTQNDQKAAMVAYLNKRLIKIAMTGTP